MVEQVCTFRFAAYFVLQDALPSYNVDRMQTPLH